MSYVKHDFCRCDADDDPSNKCDRLMRPGKSFALKMEWIYFKKTNINDVIVIFLIKRYCI